MTDRNSRELDIKSFDASFKKSLASKRKLGGTIEPHACSPRDADATPIGFHRILNRGWWKCKCGAKYQVDPAIFVSPVTSMEPE